MTIFNSLRNISQYLIIFNRIELFSWCYLFQPVSLGRKKYRRAKEHKAKMNMTKFDQFDQVSQNWLIGGIWKWKLQHSWKVYNLQYQYSFVRKLGQLTYLGKTSKINCLLRFIRKTRSMDKELKWYNIYSRYLCNL